MEITAYTPEPCGCARPLKGKRLLACVLSSKALNSSRSKASEDRLAKIQRDLLRMRRLLMVDGMRAMTSVMMDFFEERLTEFVSRVTARLEARAADSPHRKADPDPNAIDIDIDVGGVNEMIWASVLNEVFGEQANIRLAAQYLPVAQSVVARAYDRTSIIIAPSAPPASPIPTPPQPPAPASPPAAPPQPTPTAPGSPAPSTPPTVTPSVGSLRRAQELAREVTQINDTTRKQLVGVLQRGISEGSTPYEVAQQIKAEIPEIAAKRIPTIVRTEVGRGIDEGTKQAILESGTITHVSVVGCKAREASSPTYNGQSTCNIVDVPVHDIDKLRFHPNHTGAIVPSRFIGER